MSKKKFVPPFRIGDTVKHVGGDCWPWKAGGIHIITEVTLISGDIEYATTDGKRDYAWFTASGLKLVEPCTARSLQKAMKAMSNE